MNIGTEKLSLTELTELTEKFRGRNITDLNLFVRDVSVSVSRSLWSSGALRLGLTELTEKFRGRNIADLVFFVRNVCRCLCASLLVPFLALLLLANLSVQAATPDVLTVAVFDFESRDEAVRDLGPKVATLVNANLSAEPQIITVERAELEKVLGEQELGLSGTVSPDTAAKVGHLTGAKVIVTGRVFRADKELLLVAKIIGTETSRVYGELVKGGVATPISDLSAELAKKIAATVTQKGDTLVAKVESREDRIARIKKSLRADKLPTVSVKIGERHFGQPVIDPAAETELSLILQQCGFTLVDEKSKERAEVEVTGDAFSAYGMRKGNLISCKARIELKAQKPTGEILAVDRQTSVGVDVAEQTAAKTALQNAAMEVAERLAPRLAK
jgi:hypothetical protein